MSDASSFKLIIEDDEGRRSIVPVDIGEVSIGRLEGNIIRLDERNVSRHHARLFKDGQNGGGIYAEDLDSYNGVWINGDRIRGRQEVREGDLLRVGDFQLELRGEGLASRTEETTQRTLVPETTQPEIRIAPPVGLETQPAAEQAAEATPVTAGTPAPATALEDEPRQEPTAIIRMADMEALEASRRDSKAVAGQRAKLVCVSGQLAGQELEISKTEVVIGRTEDNDISINHRSVSRHHAKIVVSGRSFKIIDLKSANGTLVNGEEYVQADLKRGDLVELGHVKLRFVPPGENYTFKPDELVALQKRERADDATVPGLGSEPGRPPALKSPHVIGAIAAGGLLAVIGLVLLLLRWPSGPAPQPPAPPAAPVAQSSTAPSTFEDLVARAKAAIAQRSWSEAESFLKQALERKPGDAEAQALLDKTALEKAAKGHYAAGVAAVNGGDWTEAWNELVQVPAESSYHAQAKELLEQVRAARITQLASEIGQLIRDGDLDKAEDKIVEMESLDPAHPKVSGYRKEIEEARLESRASPRPQPSVRPVRVGQKKPPARATPAPEKTRPEPPRVTAEPPKPAADAKAFYVEGTKLLSAGKFNEAIEMFTKCVKADKSNCYCYRANGITYARAGNGPRAYSYYKQYLSVCPTAKDADQVKQLLKQYEAAQ